MKIKCINSKGSKYLFKDCIYTANRINTRSFNGVESTTVSIWGMQNQMSDKFTTLDGQKLPKSYANPNPINYKTIQRAESIYDKLKSETLKPGDIIQCRRMGLKTLEYLSLYKVESISKKGQTWMTYKIKVCGQSRHYSHNNFQMPDKQVERENKLSEILGIESEKKKEPIELLMRLFNLYKDMSRQKDQHKYNMDVYDMISEKSNFTKESIDKIRELKIGDII